MISTGLAVSIASLIIGLIGLVAGLLRWLGGSWWEKRKWYNDMHFFAEEMVPFGPHEIEDIDVQYGSYGDNYWSFIETYHSKMKSVPDEFNALYRKRPADIGISESFVECLCDEGYRLQELLEKANEGDEIDYLEVQNSVRIMAAASLIIQHQIEEEVRMFRPKRSNKLPEGDGISPKDHAEDIYQYYRENTTGNMRSRLQEAYHETNSKPWLPD